MQIFSWVWVRVSSQKIPPVGGEVSLPFPYGKKEGEEVEWERVSFRRNRSVET